ncbi:TPA: hypothetical protein ACM5NU_005538, partial [Escherichia coli]
MSNTSSNFEMTGALLGQEFHKHKTPQKKLPYNIELEYKYMELIFKYKQATFIQAQQIDRSFHSGLCFVM